MPIAVITPVRCTCRNLLDSHFFFYPPPSFFFFSCWEGEEAKINKWWSNTVYANLISHASYVLPRFHGQPAAKIAGQVTSQRLNMSDFLCNDNAIEHTVCSWHKRGHINKKRFGVKVRTIRTTGLILIHYTCAFATRAEPSLVCCVGGCLHRPPYGTPQ